MEEVRYTVVIPNERYNSAKAFKISFLLVNAFAMIYISIVTRLYENIPWAAFALLAAFILWKSKKTKQNDLASYSSIGFFLLVIGWFQLEVKWMGIAIIVIFLISLLLKEHYEVKFSDNRITINRFPKKIISWFELNNVILKDGLLTIDFKNDKLIQAEILQEEFEIESEAEFNEFCKQRLKANMFGPSND
jgi:hypothetical protein